MNKIKLILLIVISIVLIVTLVYSAYFTWVSKDKSILFSDETFNGHTVEVIQKGHRFITREYTIIIVVDDKEVGMFELYLPGREKLPYTFPSENVICETDDELQYVISFKCSDDGGRNGDRIEFTADFTEIVYVNLWYYEHLNEDIVLVK